MINTSTIITSLQASIRTMSEDFVVILGPTASGKTKFAVELAKATDAEIISADSRQVYRRMNIGTGKDLEEYGDIPYHLIDIVEPGEKYNVSRFLADFEEAYQDIVARGKSVIVCGGTGFYIQALLESQPYMEVPIDEELRNDLVRLDKSVLQNKLSSFVVPADFQIDTSSNKRLIRAIEILTWLSQNPKSALKEKSLYTAKVFGLNPSLENRRAKISSRLEKRIEDGLLEEVKTLISEGITYDELEYYGLEYKYASYYLKGQMTYQAFFTKLETEIHRYAKRQMTYFRKMEKDGFIINWI